MDEIWKPVEGYEWSYEVSSIGRVKSLKFWKERALKWSIGKCWHSQINLHLNWIRWSISISRLVAIHFIPNPDNLPCVLHKKEDLDENWALYNWADNLCWWTYSDNSQDMMKKWRANNLVKWKFWKDNPKSKPINQYTLEWEFIRGWFSTMDIQRELWIAKSSISQCCNWKRKSAWWFIWRYV